MACGGIILTKNLKIKKKSFFFVTCKFFSGSYCFMDLNRQSEHSGLRPDISSLVMFLCLVSAYLIVNLNKCIVNFKKLNSDFSLQEKNFDFSINFRLW